MKRETQQRQQKKWLWSHQRTLNVSVNKNCREQITVMYRSIQRLWKLYKDYCNKQTVKTKPGKNSQQPSKRIKPLNKT